MTAARTNAHWRRSAAIALTVLAVWTFAVGVASACNTPVYRFATYNWTPSPYRIYHVARAQPLAANDPIRDALAQLTTSPKDAPRPIANLELIEIDAAAEQPLDPLPPAVREEAAFVLERALAAETESGKKLPQFAVVLPNGYPVYEGPLTVADVRAIADSPVRRKLVEQVAAGKAAVMVVIEGDEDEDNAAAIKLIEATISRAAEGELSPAPDFTLSTTPPDAKPAQVDVGLLRIRRDDPAEKWLVLSLLHLEPEIDERTDTMVFSVYARGRVNPPAIGTGISADELERQVKFVLGPCACTIKHDNPGMDLALVANWDEIAFAMAKKYGSETGNEKILDDVPGLFPESADPAAFAEPAKPTTTEEASDEAQSATTASSSNLEATNAHGNPDGTSPLENSTSDSASPPDFETGMSLEEATRPESGNAVLLRNVGIGVLVAVVLLGVASAALLRRPA
jgi:hypothetical protein